MGNLTKILGLGLITSALTLFPMKNYAQTNEKCDLISEKNKVCFENQVDPNVFFTKEFRAHADSTGEKPFKSVEFYQMSILNQFTNVLKDVYFFGLNGNEFQIYYGVGVPFKDGFKQNEGVYGISSSKGGILKGLNDLRDARILTKKGLKDAGILKQVRNAYSTKSK